MLDTANFIRVYTDSVYTDVQNMFDYLNRNSVVGNEIFIYCDRSIRAGGRRTYSELLDTRTGFFPISRETFIRRIPFYYFSFSNFKLNLVWEDDRQEQKQGDLDGLLRNVIKDYNEEEVESFYQELEYLFYSLEIPLDRIFGYVCEQEGDSDYTLFSKWIEYVHLCEKLEWTDYTPECLIYSLNKALEAVGKEPYIYTLLPNADGSIIDRQGLYISIRGRFPIDENEEIVLKWTGIKMESIRSFDYDGYASNIGTLRIGIMPDSMIYAVDSPVDPKWINIYAGPLRTKFDHTLLKRVRVQNGMTQLEVAEAIGANVRTYQKWEAGHTIPDGFYLLRLFNWFNIKDMEEVLISDE